MMKAKESFRGQSSERRNKKSRGTEETSDQKRTKTKGEELKM